MSRTSFLRVIFSRNASVYVGVGISNEKQLCEVLHSRVHAPIKNYRNMAESGGTETGCAELPFGAKFWVGKL